jgi:hypothetical protein
MVLICAWQSHNPRYLLPMLPLAFMFAAWGFGNIFESIPWKGGVDDVLEKRRDRFRILAFVLALSPVAVVAGIDTVMIINSPVTPPKDLRTLQYKSDEAKLIHALSGEIEWGRWFQYGDWVNRRDPEATAMGWHRMIAASVWMRDNLPEDSLVMARKRRLTAYYSERKAVQYVPETRPEAFTRALHDMGVTHLLVDEVSPAVRKLLEIYMREQPGVLTPVFSVGPTHVLAVK